MFEEAPGVRSLMQKTATWRSDAPVPTMRFTLLAKGFRALTWQHLLRMLRQGMLRQVTRVTKCFCYVLWRDNREELCVSVLTENLHRLA
jgi:hypothetical protein